MMEDHTDDSEIFFDCPQVEEQDSGTSEDSIDRQPGPSHQNNAVPRPTELTKQASFLHGDNSHSVISHSTIHVGDETHVHSVERSWDIELNKCETDDKWITKSKLSWTPQLPKDAQVEWININITKDGSSVLSHRHDRNESVLDIPFKRLECGAMYVVKIVYHVRVRGKEETFDGSGKLETLPHPPTIKTCDFPDGTGHAVLKWAASVKAEKYFVSATDDSGVECMATVSTTEQCTEIPIAGELKWGKYIKFKIIAKTETGLQNSASKRIFIGDEACTPKDVFAKLTKKTEITLTWVDPEKVPKTCEFKHAINGTEKKVGPVRNRRKHTFKAEPGTTNILSIRAIFDDKESNWVSSNQIIAEARCLKVKSVTTSPCKEDPSSAIDVSWTHVREATGYNVVYETEGEKHTISVNENQRKATIRNLLPMTKYLLHVIARRGEECGIPSENDEIITGPGRPGRGVVTAAGAKITITFQAAPKCNRHKISLYEKSSSSLLHSKICEYGRNTTTVYGKHNVLHYIGITAVYDEVEGEEVYSETVLTVPEKTDVADIQAVLKEGCESNCFTVRWNKEENMEYQLAIRCCDGVSTSTTTFLIPKSQTSYTCTCPGHGRQHKVQIRAKNETGLGEWSDAKTVQTAPGEVPKFTCKAKLHDNRWIMEAEWNVPLNAETVILQLFRKSDEHFVAAVNRNAYDKRYAFEDKVLENGEAYYCEISAIIASVGEGKMKRSCYIEIPLELPEVEWYLDKENPTSKVVFSIMPSRGMKKARICISNSKQQTHTEEVAITEEQIWTYGCLQAGEEYRYMVYPGNGRLFSLECVTGDFTAAPPPPLEVLTSLREMNPETSLTVHVRTNYHETLRVTAQNAESLEDLPGVTCIGNLATISGLMPGTEYNVYAQHFVQGQSSLRTYSKPIRTALELPEVKCHLDKENPTSKVIFSIMPSGGMNKARICISNSKQRTHTEDVAINDEQIWTYSCLQAGEKYRYMVYPGNGRIFSLECVTGDFTAAPPPPLEVLPSRRERNPETSLTVHIRTDCHESLQVTAQNAANLEDEIAGSCIGNFATISGLMPGTEYNIYAQHFVQGQSSLRTYSKPIRTAHLKLTELKCRYIPDMNTVELTWTGPDDAVVCHVIHRDDTGTEQIQEASKSKHIFQNIYPGYHFFQVYADVDNKSDTCEIYVPEAPVINKINLNSSKVVEVINAKVPRANRYHHKIMCIGEKLPDLYSHSNEANMADPYWKMVDGRPTMETISDSQSVTWSLEHGLTCRVSTRAECDGFLGPMVAAEFTTEYNINEMAALINSHVNREMEESLTKIKFQPPNMQEILPDGRIDMDYNSLLSLEGGVKCVLLGENGKTTALHHFMKRKTACLLEEENNKIPPQLVIHLKEAHTKETSTTNEYVEMLLQNFHFTDSEWSKLSSYMVEHPEKLIIVKDGFKESPASDSLVLWQIQKNILCGKNFAGAMVLCSAQSLEACDVLNADKAVDILDFPILCIGQMAKDMFGSVQGAEVYYAMQKYDYLSKFCADTKYCAAVLTVIRDSLYKVGHGADIESPASVAVFALKAYSIRFGLFGLKLRELNIQPKELASGVSSGGNSLIQRFLKILSTLMSKCDKKSVPFIEDHSSKLDLRLYSGLFRETTFGEIQKLFPEIKFKSFNDRKKALLQAAKNDIGEKTWNKRAIGYFVRAEVDEPFKSPLHLHIEEKNSSHSELYRDFQDKMTDPRYACLQEKMCFTCGHYQGNDHKPEEAKKILEYLHQDNDGLRNRIGCLDIQNQADRYIGMEAIAKCLPNIARLRIADSELREEDVKMLCSEVNACNTQVGSQLVLRELNLDGNREVRSILGCLEECCQRIGKISLADCEVTEEQLQKYKALCEKHKSGALVIVKPQQSRTGSLASLEL